MIRSAGDPPFIVESCVAQDPLPRGAPGWSFGGPTWLPHTGGRIPARVRISWRLPPRDGQEMYRGDPVGPFELDINALVPANVRAAVRNSSRYQLELAFGIGLEPVTLRWRLLEWAEGMKSHREVRRGGDWTPSVSPVTWHELEPRKCRRALLRVPPPLAALDWVRNADPRRPLLGIRLSSAGGRGTRRSRECGQYLAHVARGRPRPRSLLRSRRHRAGGVELRWRCRCVPGVLVLAREQVGSRRRPLPRRHAPERVRSRSN